MKLTIVALLVLLTGCTASLNEQEKAGILTIAQAHNLLADKVVKVEERLTKLEQPVPKDGKK